jgi:O-methyltransferase involved in polyketide biosynthesis
MGVDLAGVPETLFIPLCRRARLSRDGNPILIDRQAVGLVSRVDYDFSSIEKSFVAARDIGWVARPRQMDLMLERFLKDHPRGVVVSLGSGLDTTFSRVDNGTVRWFDLDLPEVIEIRRTLLPETDRSRCIARSMFDLEWVKELGDTGDGVCLVSAGVLFYFTEAEVRQLLTGLHDRLPGAELVFDAVSTKGLEGTNRMVAKTGVKGAPVRWGLDDAKALESWVPGLEVLEQLPLFRGLSRKGLSLRTRFFMAALDLMRASIIVHCVL